MQSVECHQCWSPHWYANVNIVLRAYVILCVTFITHYVWIWCMQSYFLNQWKKCLSSHCSWTSGRNLHLLIVLEPMEEMPIFPLFLPCVFTYPDILSDICCVSTSSHTDISEMLPENLCDYWRLEISHGYFIFHAVCSAWNVDEMWNNKENSASLACCVGVQQILFHISSV